MSGIRINKIVDARLQYEKWGERLGQDKTGGIVSRKLPYPLRVLKYMPGPARKMLKGIVENSPEVSYMTKVSNSRKLDPVMPMISTAVEMLFNEEKPDGSGKFSPNDFDALIVAGSPFSVGDPPPEIMIKRYLDSEGIITSRVLEGKRPHTKPWCVEVISKSCVSWFKALRRVEELIGNGKIKSAIVVSFGRPTYYIDAHKLYEVSNHRDDATASAVQRNMDEQTQIEFGDEVNTYGNQEESGSNGTSGQSVIGGQKNKGIVHEFNTKPLSRTEQWSFSPRTCLEGLDDSQSSSDFIASQCAKSLIEMSEKRGVPLDQFDAILLPQVSETFLDKVETFLAYDLRKKMGLKMHIRDDLRQIVLSYCKTFDEYQRTTGKKKDEICRNFNEVLKESEKPESNGELYQSFLSKLTPDETRLFNFMRNVRSKNFRTYQSVGYTTSNSIPGGLALGVQSERFSLDNSFAIASGALGYSFDGLTMNAPPKVSSDISTAETVVDVPVSRWNRVCNALRAIGF